MNEHSDQPQPKLSLLEPGWLQREFDATADDMAVDAFAAAMKMKLARKRIDGRGGWQSCPKEILWAMLREHVEKGDPVDIANFAMMIWGVRQAKELQDRG